jgi:predicted nucleic acid-binding protein
MTDGLARPHLIDSNILLRISRRDDPDHAVVDRAIATLAEAGAVFYYTHQNVTEFWNVATRPANLNGFGLSVEEANQAVQAFESGMTFLPDNEDVYHEWRRLVLRHSVLGVKVYDARLVAAMVVHKVPHLLTLNEKDFRRYARIVAIHPRMIAAR